MNSIGSTYESYESINNSVNY